MSDSNLSGGFANPETDAARAFRAALNAMAQPGRIETLPGVRPPSPLSSASGALLLTLIDHEAPVFLAGSYDAPAVRQWLAFHAGVDFVPAAQAAFAVGTWTDLLPLSQFAMGTPEYPERSATLIVAVDALKAEGTHLTGPGIRTEAFLNLPDEQVLAENAARFPLGLDFFFTAGDQLAALPRSTRIGR